MSDYLGLMPAIARSRWRRNRLLILCYHGVSLEDEHIWDPALYVSAELFHERMKSLRSEDCKVLSLSGAFEHLRNGTLPPKAVVITFDDGLQNFYSRAFPILREFGYPVTLYLTTYYCTDQRPIFNLICSYMFWKSGLTSVDMTDLFGEARVLQIGSDWERKEAMQSIFRFAQENKLSADDKELFARKLALQLQLDYDQFSARRIMHIMSADEVREIARGGVDIQIHTHRHRMPTDPALFVRELEDNRQAIVSLIGGSRPIHFCYPSGVYRREFLPLIKGEGIVTATTCETGIASTSCDPLLLPRLLDTQNLSALEFKGWLNGISAFLPQRHS